MKLNLLNFVFYVHLPCTKVETAGKVHMARETKANPSGACLIILMAINCV